MNVPRDDGFRQALGELIALRAKQAEERGEHTVHVGDVETPEYRWFFDAGVDFALAYMIAKMAREAR